jgi:putative flippase GtrA
MTALPSPHSLRSWFGRVPFLPGGAAAKLVRFAAIGVVSTAAYIGLYAALRNISPAAAANALALVITAVGNTAANRRLTFEVRGRDGLARHHAAGMLALVVALGITSGSLGILQFVAPHHGRLSEIAALVAANAAATVVRFVLLRIAIDDAGQSALEGKALRPVTAGPALDNHPAPSRTRR